MDKRLWYKMLGKEDAFDRSLFYKINDEILENNGILEAIEDPTKYKLDLGKGKMFLFSKKTKNILLGDPDKDYVVLTKDELKKVLNFAKKNGLL